MQSKYNRLTTQQWEIMKKYLPTKTKGHYSLREIVDSILWILRTGSQWRNLPDCYPKWQRVCYHFKKWEKDGTLIRLNSSLNQLERGRVGKEATPSMLSIDSQSVKSSSFISQDKGVDGNKKINGRKRHLITDT